MGSIIVRAKRIARIRLISQIAALVVLCIPFLGLRSICGPAFHCHSCPLSAFACPIGVLVNFSTLRLFPYAAIGILGFIGTLGGRLVCGWVCPFGLLQDVLGKIRRRKVVIPLKLTYTRYVMLVGLVFLVPLLFPEKPYTFCHFCPAGTLESTIPWAFMGVSSGFKFGFFARMFVLAGVLVLVVTTYRGFCRTLCPLGAVFSLFNRISLFRLNMTEEDCDNCGACSKTCLMKVDPVIDTNGAECIRCLDCTSTQHLKLGTR